MRYAPLVVIAAFLLLLAGCVEKNPRTSRPTLFELRDPDSTGVTFTNGLSESPALNIVNYLYYYNGGGVAVGDVNGDDLPDLYFTANERDNRLYLNQGDFTFRDVTEEAGVAGTADWTTGVTMADVNGDGTLDIYVSAVHGFRGLEGSNQLYINQGAENGGVPHFEERAAAFGLDVQSYATQAAFFDYDMDGDLDVYLLNHSMHQEETYGRRARLLEERHPKAGDQLLENRNGTFVDASKEAGIYGSRIGYGLGVSVTDLNVDGCPDIYVGNDFHENDYLYVNNCDGTFTEQLQESIGHTSLSSMGTDAADVNNDGRPDVVVLDMLPDDEAIRKTSAGPERLDIYNAKRRYGYAPQYARNTLQLNQGRGRFSEIGLLAGIEATDWSWAPLLADYNLDGRTDLFVTNGIYRRPNDLDYVRYASDRGARAGRAARSPEDSLALRKRMPQVPIANYAFRNDSTGLGFRDVSSEWGFTRKGFSNGAAYADLDNDGDLDLVVNNLEAPASLYENRARRRTDHHFLRIDLTGTEDNTHGIGAKVTVHDDGTRQMQTLMPTRGFQSSVPSRLLFGLDDQTSVDSVSVVWPDGTAQVRPDVEADQTLTFRQSEAVPVSSSPARPASPGERLFADVTDAVDVPYEHEENDPVDFNREPLLPHALSMEGPALAVADVNGDGLEDLFVGGAKHQPARLLLQRPGPRFVPASEETWRNDKVHEDVDAAFFDADGDGDQDLYVVSGGNEFWGDAEALRDRLYLNDGTGDFRRANSALPDDMYANGATVSPGDYDEDGDVDLFVGGRVVARQYGTIPDSYLLENDGSGTFTDVTSERAPGLRKAGMVTDAVWADATGDDGLDLVVVGAWMPITVWAQRKNRFVERTDAVGLGHTNGWWNTIEALDADADGDVDFVAGNLGRNSTLRAGPEEPVRAYINDFDDNGQTEPILTRYRNGTSYPIAGRDRLAEQLGFIEQKFPTYESFGAATIEDIVPEGTVESATVYEARTFASTYVENVGDSTFNTRPLPTRAQFTPMYDVWASDLNQNGHTDVVLGGNFYGVTPAQGRYDASYGSVLLGAGSGRWEALSPVRSNLYLEGQVRALRALRTADGTLLLVAARNDAPLQLLDVRRPKRPTAER